MGKTCQQTENDILIRFNVIFRLGQGWFSDVLQIGEPLKEETHLVRDLFVKTLVKLWPLIPEPTVISPTLEGGVRLEWGNLEMLSLEYIPKEGITINDLETIHLEGLALTEENFMLLAHYFTEVSDVRVEKNLTR